MRIFSGVQPTGQLHIGNYLGAIKQWVDFQKENECIFSVVDLHSITIPYDTKNLSKNIKEVATAYMAAGIDPDKSILFVQSNVKEHTELCWLLNTVCPVGDLFRMTQYKEKSKQFSKNINAGLLNYPILMAADILLYKAMAVPVGEDQVQHVELARTIARKFNKKFGDTFPEPKPILSKTGAKIMALDNPKKKMSKSGAPSNYISLFESPESIQRKIMSAVTDTGKGIKYDVKKKAGISNLLNIYSLFSGKEIKEIEAQFEGRGYAEFKKSLSQLLIEKLEPFRSKMEDLSLRDTYIKELLDKGADKARIIAAQTMEEVRQKMGLN